jgi:hypothetical protein
MRSVALILAALLAAAPSAHADEQKSPQVVLEPSFRIPQQEGNQISHVPAVLFTKDGKRVITGTSNGEVIVWETATRRNAARFKFADSPIAALALDPNGKFLVVLLENGALKTVDWSGKTLAAVEKVEAAKTMRVAPDGETLALARGLRLEVRSIRTLDVQLDLIDAGVGEVTELAFSPDGKRLGCVGRAGVVAVLSYPKLGQERTMKKGQPLYALAFAPDGTRIAYGGDARAVHELTLASGDERVITENQPYWITTLGYSPDGKTLAFGDESCDVWVFDVASKKNLFHSKHHVECWLSQVAWAPDNETFLFGCRPNTHAGTPSIYAENERQEVAAFADVQAAAKTTAERQAALEKCYAEDSNRALWTQIQELRQKQAALAPRQSAQSLNAMPQAGTAAIGGAGGAVLSLGDETELSVQVLEESGATLAAPDAGQQLAAVQTQSQLRVNRVFAPLTEEQKQELAEIEAGIAHLDAQLAAKEAVRNARRDLEVAAREHRDTLQKRQQEIQGSFNVNQWKLKK